MTKEQILTIFNKNSLRLGRCFGSKSGYRAANPSHLVVFNACVYNNEESIWWGDLDLTLDSNKLQNVANELGINLYVLRESDGRWDKPDKKIKELAVKIFEFKS